MLSKRVEMEAVDPVTLSICYVRLSHDRARYQWARLWIARHWRRGLYAARRLLAAHDASDLDRVPDRSST